VPTDDINIFVAIVEAFDPIIAEIIDVIPFPINAAIGFIWGGIKELITEVLFG